MTETSTPTKSPLVTPALVLGIVAVLLGALSFASWVGIFAAVIGLFVALAAVTIGHIALPKSGSRKTVAVVALVAGYLGLALVIASVVQRMAAMAAIMA